MWRTHANKIARWLYAARMRREAVAPAARERAALGMRIAAGACALVLSAAFLTPAGAQSGMKRVTDANNRFSIAFPARWTVESIQQNTRILATEVPISSLPQGSSSRSAMVGTGPGGDFNVPPRLVVVPLDLPRPVTPEDISTYVQQNSVPNPNFQMTQNGFATIAGQHAFYMYGVGRDPGQSTSQYAVLVYIAQGREGFLMVGSTLNDPDRIKRDFTAISQILETFRIIPQHGLVNGPGTTAIAFPTVALTAHASPSPRR